MNPGLKAYAIKGRKTEGEKTILLETVSCGVSAEDAIRRYLVHLQPLQHRNVDGTPPTMFERHELTAEVMP
jgi:hypothetical protein